jgi:uncharacterized membrane protein YphA (DoxX/SURF4 family)
MSPKTKNILLWVVTGLLVVRFIWSGTENLISEDAAKQFEDFGYPGDLRYLVGGALIAGALGLLVPRIAWLAAAGLAVIMAGAVVSHLRDKKDQIVAIVPAVFLVLVVVVGWARRPWAPKAPAAPG